MSRHLASIALVLMLCHLGHASAQSEPANGSRVEFALSNDTLLLRYAGSGRRVGVNDASLTGAFFLSEHRDLVLSGGLLFPAGLDWGRLQIAFGPQVYAALLKDENSDVFAATVGAEARLQVSRQLAVSGQAFYGPDILTFGSADSLTDLSARVEFGMAERITAFAGMRWFEFDLTNGEGENTLQEEMFVGIGYRF